MHCQLRFIVRGTLQHHSRQQLVPRTKTPHSTGEAWRPTAYTSYMQLIITLFCYNTGYAMDPKKIVTKCGSSGLDLNSHLHVGCLELKMPPFLGGGNIKEV